MNRWQVFRRGSYLGIMTAAEIRRALREGAVDPFDLVCREGSQLRVEILEVDEIFTAQEAGASDGFTQIGSVPMPAAAASGMPPTSYVHHIHHQQQYAPASAQQPRMHEPYGRRKSQKKFYLIDRNGRMLGPLAAGEIQSLATRGIIGGGVYVQRMGDPKKISLSSFLRDYARANSRARRGIDLRSSAALNAVYRGMAARRYRSSGSLFPYFMVTIVGAILGFLVYFALHPQKGSDGRRVKHRQERRVEQRGSSPKLKRIMQQEKAKAVRSKKPVAVVKPTKKPAPTNVQKVTSQRTKAAEKVLKKQAKAKKVVSQPAPKKRTPAAVAKKAPVKRRAPIAPQKARAVVKVPPRSKPKSPPRAVAPPPVRRPAPVAQQLVDGQPATLPGMNYSIAELDECPIKCKLRFSKPGGPTVTAVFFKGAHLDALLAKRGNATISGHVKKQGADTQIFLESVR